jgi:Spy/CpxP family protein refolding chaperone
MKKDQQRKGVVIGLLFLCVTPGLTRAQSSTPSPMPARPKAAPVSRPQRVPSKADDFAGLNLTDDQKAQVDQIHRSMETRRDAVVKDEKLTAAQREAMLDGYERMERGQVFKVLTAEQRKEVRNRILIRRAAEQAGKKKQSPPK